MEPKHISQILPNVLTEASAQPTKEQQLNIADWAAWLKFETLGDPELEKLTGTCARWMRRVKGKSKPSWVSLLGKTGTGKTHCARMLYKKSKTLFNWDGVEFLESEIYWPEFVSRLRSGEAYEQLRDMIEWPVLFLDDIGAERDTTGFASEQLNMLLGRRVGKWTILTSNLGLEQLAGIDPRISDRIIREPGNEYIELTTASYAVRKLSA